MNHNELKALTGAVFADGNLWAVREDGSVLQITGDNALEEFRHLRNASLLMYRTLTNAEDWIDKLTLWLEAAGGEVAVNAALNMQAAIRVSRRVALEGLENIAEYKKGD